MTGRSPRVFVSHSHQDKDRFVVPFATALRSKGIDAWVDHWELLPGDSLVDKIFEEGLEHAAAMVIVLSEHSVRSKWVREELNSGFVARVEKGMRLIPIVIDDVEVPQALKHIVRVRARGPEDFRAAVDAVTNAVYQTTTRPPLGPQPGFTQLAPVPGLQVTDTLVLQRFGARTMEGRDINPIDTEDVWRDVETQGVNRDAYEEALGVLAGAHFLEPSPEVAPVPRSFHLSAFGMEQYLRHFFRGYPDAIKEVVADLINQKPTSLEDMLRRVQVPEVVIRHVLHRLEDDGYIEIADALGGFLHIVEIRQQLRRLL